VLLRKFKVEIDQASPGREAWNGPETAGGIVKALSKNSNILVLDEPTEPWQKHEVLILLDILRDLRSRGIASIYISHKSTRSLRSRPHYRATDGASIADARTARKRTKRKSLSTWSGAKLAISFRATDRSLGHQP